MILCIGFIFYCLYFSIFFLYSSILWFCSTRLPSYFLICSSFSHPFSPLLSLSPLFLLFHPSEESHPFCMSPSGS